MAARRAERRLLYKSRNGRLLSSTSHNENSQSFSMRFFLAAVSLWFACGLNTAAHAAQTANDKVFANAALRSLHDLARAAAQYEQAAKDSDQLGCHDAFISMQKVAHEALINVHSMSFAPIDAIEDVSILLRLSQLVQNGCSDDVATQSLFMMAGQAVMALRYDYSIGDGDWYMIAQGGTIEAKNPLQYARSLKDQGYSWVSVRPNGMLFMVVSNWKAEMASSEADDPSIENSGSNLKAIEVGYRQNSGDSNTTVYFYRTKEDARAAMEAAGQQAKAVVKADADLKASKAEWNKKLTSLPYMIADRNPGFKLIYGVCRDTGKKDTNGAGICTEDDSHDYSDSRGAPYSWFADIQSCTDAQLGIFDKRPPDVKVNPHDAFVSSCVPAPKTNGHALKGYQMVFALITPGAVEDDAVYAELREQGSSAATVFRTFKSCDDAIDTGYSATLKDLGADKDGNLLSDKTKSLDFRAKCVRVY